MEKKEVHQAKARKCIFFSELLRSGWGEAGKKVLSLHKLDPTSCQQCKSCFTSMTSLFSSCCKRQKSMCASACLAASTASALGLTPNILWCIVSDPVYASPKLQKISPRPTEKHQPSFCKSCTNSQSLFFFYLPLTRLLQLQSFAALFYVQLPSKISLKTQ